MSDINELNVGRRWYVAHTFTGYENKVKASLEKVIENRKLEEKIFNIQIPTETVIEKKKDGSEKIVEHKLFPGYIYIEMIMTEETWHAVRNITGVTSFVGPGSKPVPLPEEEVAKLITSNALKVEVKETAPVFKIGDSVEVVTGLFEGMTGIVQSVSDDAKTVTVLIKRGRRDMPVEIDSGSLKPEQY
ncbi:MAG: transcription termination/antitermination factor NusG [Clostridia bacterium]|nr:transcription termination/antitermination factor NusG [Clostridia bacterium]